MPVDLPLSSCPSYIGLIYSCWNRGDSLYSRVADFLKNASPPDMLPRQPHQPPKSPKIPSQYSEYIFGLIFLKFIRVHESSWRCFSGYINVRNAVCGATDKVKLQGPRLPPHMPLTFANSELAAISFSRHEKLFQINSHPLSRNSPSLLGMQSFLSNLASCLTPTIHAATSNLSRQIYPTYRHKSVETDHAYSTFGQDLQSVAVISKQ